MREVIAKTIAKRYGFGPAPDPKRCLEDADAIIDAMIEHGPTDEMLAAVPHTNVDIDLIDAVWNNLCQAMKEKE